MKILLTGCAGFIGSHVLDRLLADGHTVVGVDNFDPFYARSLKSANIAAHLNRDLAGENVEKYEPSSLGELRRSRGGKVGKYEGGNVSGEPSNLPTFNPSNPTSKGSFELIEADLADETAYTKIKFIAEGLSSNSPPASIGGVPERSNGRCASAKPSHLPAFPPSDLASNGTFDAIIHLAAKAGVRPSIQDPVGYQRANVIATQNLLEFAKEQGIKQFVFASSSSVYGVNPNVPWREDDHVLQPISPYASTKVSCELMGHVYSHLYGIRVLGLRFFTVYGPRQRPDLAINKFVRLIEAGEPIPVFGDGSTRRDYTYVGDIVDGIISAVEKSVASGPPAQGGNNKPKTGEPKTAEPVGGLPPYAVVNLGNDQTITLSQMIETIETVVGKKAIIDRQPEQPGDVPQTWADVSKARKLLGYAPTTSFKQGVQSFYDWWTNHPGMF